ncbi:hypothetical protein SASPL_128003 [Salvia splendens]|uniref:Uncharacterized protein n=1 Tax=Salvia splendens TaxID=180675 RepID=A0A8X8XC81_SALSN|nr:hypothetical protein SASPL_128003 [Salvia splendens]
MNKNHERLANLALAGISFSVSLSLCGLTLAPLVVKVRPKFKCRFDSLSNCRWDVIALSSLLHHQSFGLVYEITGHCGNSRNLLLSVAFDESNSKSEETDENSNKKAD